MEDGVLRLDRPGTRWLSTGWDGGFAEADTGYNVTVPDGWNCEELGSYVAERLAAAGFGAERTGPVLLTGVAQRHARGARCGPVTALATAGLSNPAALPLDPAGGDLPADPEPVSGTVNVFVGATRALDDAALANLISVATEAKTATLLGDVGFTGTTTDAVVVACDPAGAPAPFSGSATRVGAATRAAVREAVTASLQSRYDDEHVADSVADARHGVRTDVRADVFVPGRGP